MTITAIDNQVGTKELYGWEGKADRSFTRRTSTGGTLTNYQIGNAVDVLSVYGDNTSFTTAAINSAISAIGTNPVPLEFAPGTWAITANVTIPATITVIRRAGAKFQITNGYKLTVAGKYFSDDYGQNFDDQNTNMDGVVLSGCSNPVASWWWDGTSDFSPCITAAVKCHGAAFVNGRGYDCHTSVYIPYGTYPCTTSINLTNCYDFTIQGCTMRGTILECAHTSAAMDLVGASFFKLTEFTISGDQTSQPTVGILYGRSKDAGGAQNVNAQSMTVDRLSIEGYFSYGGAYLVSTELILWKDFRMKFYRDAGGIMMTPTNALSFTSDYVTINTDAPYRDTQVGSTFRDFKIYGDASSYLYPFLIYGPYEGGYESGHGYTSTIHIHSGYCYCHNVEATSCFIRLIDGSGEIHVHDLDIEGMPETIVRVNSTTADPCNNYHISLHNIHALGTPFALKSDAQCTLYGLRIENLFIGSTNTTWAATSDTNTSNIEILGNLYESYIGPQWWGFYITGELTVSGASRGNTYHMATHTITRGSNMGDNVYVTSRTAIGQGLHGGGSVDLTRGSVCQFGDVVSGEYELTGTTVTGPTIPAGSILLAITARITEAITGSSGFSVGILGATTRFIDVATTALSGGAVYMMDGVTSMAFAAATDILITRKASDFTNGTLYLAVHYLKVANTTH